MTSVPDAWEDEWSTTADKSPTPPGAVDSKKPSTKVSKAQRRAQQAEFNKQLWAEAEGPKETNFFLESRNAPPLRSDFKPPPILLSRKGPTTKSQTSKVPTNGVQSLTLKHESSEDEEENAARELTLAERQAQATRDREEKQRKYEERRQELFGTTLATSTSAATNKSGTSSPVSLTPPGSRSATPNRGRGGRGGRRGGGGGGSSIVVPQSHPQSQTHHRPQPQQQRDRELFDPSYTAKPDSTYVQRRENGGGGGGSRTTQPQLRSDDLVQPIRHPKGPDGSGRAGFGFGSGSRGGGSGGAKELVGTAGAKVVSSTSEEPVT